MTKRIPKRGDVWLVNFDPSIGTEIQKTRPAVIVSNNIANKYLEHVQVVPITSNVSKIYPSEVAVTFANKKGKVMADQIMTASKRRLYKYKGKLKESDVSALNTVLKLQLNLQ